MILFIKEGMAASDFNNYWPRILGGNTGITAFNCVIHYSSAALNELIAAGYSYSATDMLSWSHVTFSPFAVRYTATGTIIWA